MTEELTDQQRDILYGKTSILTYDCPICGRNGNVWFHHCPPKTLAAIDASETRARNGNDSHLYDLYRTYSHRLDEAQEIYDMAHQ